MSALPPAWLEVPLQAITEVILGQSPPGDSYNHDKKGLPFFQGKAEFGEMRPSVRKWTTDPRKIAQPDDVLLSVRAPVGPTNLAPCECAIGRGLVALRPLGGIDPRYVLYGIRATGHALASQATGTTFAAVSGSQVRAHLLPLAPLNEQRRIVDAIDEQFSRLDVAVNLLSRAESRVSGLRRWLVRQAISGDWPRKSIGDLTINFDGRRIPVKASDRAKRRGDYPYYGASGVIDTIDDYLFDGEFLLIAEDGANLLSRSKPIAFPARGRFWVNNHAHVVQTTDAILQEYLALLLNGTNLSFAITGTAQPKLTQANLNRFLVPVPPVDEQRRIVLEVEHRTSVIDAMRDAIRVATRRGEALRRSILDRGFRGELVRHDPNDEPVAQLLAGIAERRPSAASRRRRKVRA